MRIILNRFSIPVVDCYWFGVYNMKMIFIY